MKCYMLQLAGLLYFQSRAMGRWKHSQPRQQLHTRLCGLKVWNWSVTKYISDVKIAKKKKAAAKEECPGVINVMAVPQVEMNYYRTRGGFPLNEKHEWTKLTVVNYLLLHQTTGKVE